MNKTKIIIYSIIVLLLIISTILVSKYSSLPIIRDATVNPSNGDVSFIYSIGEGIDGRGIIVESYDSSGVQHFKKSFASGNAGGFFVEYIDDMLCVYICKKSKPDCIYFFNDKGEQVEVEYNGTAADQEEWKGFSSNTPKCYKYSDLKYCYNAPSLFNKAYKLYIEDSDGNVITLFEDSP